MDYGLDCGLEYGLECGHSCAHACRHLSTCTFKLKHVCSVMSQEGNEDREAVIVLSDCMPTKKEHGANSVIVISDSTASAVFTPTKR